MVLIAHQNGNKIIKQWFNYKNKVGNAIIIVDEVMDRRLSHRKACKVWASRIFIEFRVIFFFWLLIALIVMLVPLLLVLPVRPITFGHRMLAKWSFWSNIWTTNNHCLRKCRFFFLLVFFFFRYFCVSLWCWFSKNSLKKNTLDYANENIRQKNIRVFGR